MTALAGHQQLDSLLDALTTAAETGHGYLPARRAIVQFVADLQAELAQRNLAISTYQDRIIALGQSDDLPDMERLA